MSELMISNNDVKLTSNPVKEAAISLIELEEQANLIKLQIEDKKERLLSAMMKLGVKTIKFQAGEKISVVTKRNVKVDKKKASIYLDSNGQLEQFSKLDETKIKEVFYNEESNTSYPFIIVEEPTTYIQIKKEK